MLHISAIMNAQPHTACLHTYTYVHNPFSVSTQGDGYEPGLATEAPAASATPGPPDRFAALPQKSKNMRYVKSNFHNAPESSDIDSNSTQAQLHTCTFHPFPHSSRQVSCTYRTICTWTMKPRSNQGESTHTHTYIYIFTNHVPLDARSSHKSCSFCAWRSSRSCLSSCSLPRHSATLASLKSKSAVSPSHIASKMSSLSRRMRSSRSWMLVMVTVLVRLRIRIGHAVRGN